MKRDAKCAMVNCTQLIHKIYSQGRSRVQSTQKGEVGACELTCKVGTNPLASMICVTVNEYVFPTSRTQYLPPFFFFSTSNASGS